MNSITTSTVAIVTVGQCNWLSRPRNDEICGMNSSPSTATPVIFPNCPEIMMTATPAM